MTALNTNQLEGDLRNLREKLTFAIDDLLHDAEPADMELSLRSAVDLLLANVDLIRDLATWE